MWRSRRLRAAEAERERLEGAVAGIDSGRRAAFYAELTEQTKDPDTYAALAWTIIGIQHFYLGDTLKGVLVVAAFVLGIVTLPLGIGIVILIATLLYEIHQCAESQAIVLEHNNSVKARLLHRHGGPAVPRRSR